MQKLKKSNQPRPGPNFQLEKDIRKSWSVQRIVGVDEVGRGAIAGPIIVAAVELTKQLPNINDSKLLSKNTRTLLATKIHHTYSQCRIGWATNNEIDKLGVAKSLALAYDRALRKIEAQLILTDHVKLNRPHISSVRGDQLFYSVAAASIVAKVYRDTLMRVYHQFYSDFDWDNNVGYGTKRHFDGISRSGLTNLHRQTFIK